DAVDELQLLAGFHAYGSEVVVHGSLSTAPGDSRRHRAQPADASSPGPTGPARSERSSGGQNMPPCQGATSVASSRSSTTTEAASWTTFRPAAASCVTRTPPRLTVARASASNSIAGGSLAGSQVARPSTTSSRQ